MRRLPRVAVVNGDDAYGRRLVSEVRVLSGDDVMEWRRRAGSIVRRR